MKKLLKLVLLLSAFVTAPCTAMASSWATASSEKHRGRDGGQHLLFRPTCMLARFLHRADFSVQRLDG